MNTLDETVERLGQFAELILRGDCQTLGQIALAVSDVTHRPTHLMQGLHQHANQQAQQQDDHHHHYHHGGDGRGTELGQHGVGGILLEDQCHVPVGRRNTLNRREGNDLRLFTGVDFSHAGSNFRSIGRVGFTDVLEHQFAVRMHQNLAVGTDQECIAMAIEVQRVDDLGDVVQSDISTGHAHELILKLDRCGHGHDQLARGCRDVGFGHNGARRILCRLVPATRTRIVVSRAIGRRHREHHAFGAAKVAQLKAFAVGRQADGALQLGQFLAIRGDLLRHRLQQLHAAFQPGLNVLCGERTQLLQLGLDAGFERLTLSIVIDDNEHTERHDHNQCGGEKDLFAETQTFHSGYFHGKKPIRTISGSPIKLHNSAVYFTLQPTGRSATGADTPAAASITRQVRVSKPYRDACIAISARSTSP